MFLQNKIKHSSARYIRYTKYFNKLVFYSLTKSFLQLLLSLTPMLPNCLGLYFLYLKLELIMRKIILFVQKYTSSKFNY